MFFFFFGVVVLFCSFWSEMFPWKESSKMQRVMKGRAVSRKCKKPGRAGICGPEGLHLSSKMDANVVERPQQPGTTTEAQGGEKERGRERERERERSESE